MPKISEKLYIALSFLVISITIIVYIVFGFTAEDNDVSDSLQEDLIKPSIGFESLGDNEVLGWTKEDHRVAAEWYISLVKEYNYNDEYRYQLPGVLPTKEYYEALKEDIINIEELQGKQFPRSFEEIKHEWISIEGRTLALMSSGCGPALGEWWDLVYPDPDDGDFRKAGVNMEEFEKSLDNNDSYAKFVKNGGIDPVFIYNRNIIFNLLNECGGYNESTSLTEEQAKNILRTWWVDDNGAKCPGLSSVYDSRILEFGAIRVLVLEGMDDVGAFGPIIEIPMAGWIQNGGGEIINEYIKSLGYSCELF